MQTATDLAYAREIPTVPINGPFVSLLPVSMEGLQEFHEYSILPQFYAHLEYPPFETIDESQRYLEALIHRSYAPEAQYWFVCLSESNKVVGTFGLHNLDIRRASVEMGYGISPAYWGRGIFTTAARMVVYYAFEHLSIHRITAKTSARNLASIRGLEKLGFETEGVMRNFYRTYKGEWFDAVLLSKLKVDE